MHSQVTSQPNDGTEKQGWYCGDKQDPGNPVFFDIDGYHYKGKRLSYASSCIHFDCEAGAGYNKDMKIVSNASCTTNCLETSIGTEMCYLTYILVRTTTYNTTRPPKAVVPNGPTWSDGLHTTWMARRSSKI